MNKRQYQRLVEALRACDPEVILRAAGHCDGHSILKPELFIQAGLPQEVVDHVTRTYTSDGSPKGTIFVRGQPVKECQGVYGLDLLRFIASAIDLDYRSPLGRGFVAQNIQQALHQRLGGVKKGGGS